MITKSTLSILAIGLSASFAVGDAHAANYLSTAVCRPAEGYQAVYTDISIKNSSSTQTSTIVCPLKVITVAASTTLSVTVVGNDGDSATDAAGSLVCRLRIQNTVHPYFVESGNPFTLSSSAWASMTVSHTTTAAHTDVWAVVTCTLPRSVEHSTHVLSLIGTNF